MLDGKSKVSFLKRQADSFKKHGKKKKTNLDYFFFLLNWKA